VRRLLAVLLSCLVLAGCGPADDGGGTAGASTAGAEGGSSARSAVDVDTPALRSLKQQAGIAACPAATSTSDLPQVSLPCLGGGRSVALSRLRGPVVINLFAQWCGPCRKELPFYQELSEKAHGRVQVLGVDYEDTLPARALELARASGVRYPLLADPSALLRKPFGVRGLPGIVLVDRHGKVRPVQLRAFRSYAELRDVVQQQLGVTLPA
jgi:thiol-disulfide isomerase/thioredoxin